MALVKLGGEFPDVKYGSEITLQTPDGISESAPVEIGDLFKIGGPADDGTQLKAIPCVAADSIDGSDGVIVQAKERMTVVGRGGGFKIITGSTPMIRRLKYVSGSAPTLGQSVAVHGTNLRRIVGVARAQGNGLVVAVNTADLEVECLIGV